MAVRTERVDAVAVLAGLPHDDLRHEMVEGWHHVTPLPHMRHQRVVARLVRALADTHPDADVVAGANITTYEDSLVCPDVVVTTTRDVDALYLVPEQVDLVVEVLSPGTRHVDLIRKAALFAAWTTEYWVADPVASTLTLYDDEGHPATVLEPGQVVPRTDLGVADLFA